ncbi:MAG: zinc ribbon domain-containing protein [Lachnospiraceae bacterium]|nr:zinc ribbon domain-containing protein [Lachnospiraceae bacterium]
MAVKCRYCGASMGLEDRYCPHCGRTNEVAAQHAKDMEQYETSYRETRTDVYKTVHRHAGSAVRAVILAFLILGSIVCVILGNNGYLIRWRLRERWAIRNQRAVMEQMDECIAGRKWRSLSGMEDYYGLRTHQAPWEEYNGIPNAASAYGWIESALMGVVFAKEDEDRSYHLSSLSNNVDYFLETIDPEKNKWRQDSEKALAAYSAMEEDMKALFLTYFDIDEEGWEDMKAMSSFKRAVFIEEKANER